MTTPDGRQLRAREAGDPEGRPVLVQNGTPCAGSLLGPHAEDARTRGIRLIAYDRPGYGGSTRAPGRSVADAAADVAALADALEIDRLATWGISGGGPHTLACASLLPDRLVAAAVLGSPAPYGADGLDWLAGMGEGNIVEFEAALDGRETLEPLLAVEAEKIGAADAAELVDRIDSLLSPVDRAALTGGLADDLLALFQAGVAGGVEGWLEDDLAFAKPWGFDLGAIRVPVLLWHGEQDRFVSAAHGRWLAGRIPGAEARITEDDGHLTLFRDRIPDVHAWLSERF